jgi:putative FmdB family regulatory protein
MPFYDFKCDKCEKIVEEFFKIADEKKIECCGIQMKQVILSAPGLSDPGGRGNKWTNDGYQIRDSDRTSRIVTEKWEKGKNVIRSDVHQSDPRPDEIKTKLLKTKQLETRKWVEMAKMKLKKNK